MCCVCVCVGGGGAGGSIRFFMGNWGQDSLEQWVSTGLASGSTCVVSHSVTTQK